MTLLIMDASILDLSEKCLSLFKECLLLPHLAKDHWAEGQLRAFLLWCTSMGVFARGQASADDRLKEHELIRSSIADLLDALQRSLQKGICTFDLP